MKRYRVKYEMEFDDGSEFGVGTAIKADRKVFSKIEDAQRRALLYGPEPWKAFSREADDDWCHAKGGGKLNQYGECYCEGQAEHTTAKEFWDRKRAELRADFVRAWIEEREITRWRRVEEPSR